MFIYTLIRYKLNYITYYLLLSMENKDIFYCLFTSYHAMYNYAICCRLSRTFSRRASSARSSHS